MTATSIPSGAGRPAEAYRERAKPVDPDSGSALMEAPSDPVTAPPESRSGTAERDASGIDSEFVTMLLDGLSDTPPAASNETDRPYPRHESDFAWIACNGSVRGRRRKCARGWPASRGKGSTGTVCPGAVGSLGIARLQFVSTHTQERRWSSRIRTPLGSWSGSTRSRETDGTSMAVRSAMSPTWVAVGTPVSRRPPHRSGRGR